MYICGPSTCYSTRSSRSGKSVDDLLQASQHLSLLKKNCNLSQNVSLHLRHLLIVGTGLILTCTSVLLSCLRPSSQDNCMMTMVIMDGCHCGWLTIYSTKRIESSNFDKHLVRHTSLRRTTLRLRANTHIYLSLCSEFDIVY